MKGPRVAAFTLALFSLSAPLFAVDRPLARAQPATLVATVPPRAAAAPDLGQAGRIPQIAASALAPAPRLASPAAARADESSAAAPTILSQTEDADAQVRSALRSGDDDAARRFFSRVFDTPGAALPVEEPAGVSDDLIAAFLKKADRYVYPSEKNDAISGFVEENSRVLTVAQAQFLLDSMIIKHRQIDRGSAMQSYNRVAGRFMGVRMGSMSWEELKGMLARLQPVPGGSHHMAWDIQDEIIKAYAGSRASDAAHAVEVASYGSSAGVHNWAIHEFFDARGDNLPWSEFLVLIKGLRKVSPMSGHASRAKTQKEMVRRYYDVNWPVLGTGQIAELAGLTPDWSGANWMLEDFVKNRIASLSRADIDALIAALRRGAHLLSESGYTRKLTAERILRRSELQTKDPAAAGS